MSGFGPREDMEYYVGFMDQAGIDETLTFVSSRWQMGVDLRLTVERQFGEHRHAPPQFRVLRTDGSWGDWHPLREGHPLRADARALQFAAAPGCGETHVGLKIGHFLEHPEPHAWADQRVHA